MSLSKPQSDLLNHLRSESLLGLQGTVLVAVSGGADSIALLAALSELGKAADFDCHVVHVNHQLRDDADDDAKFVEQFATDLGLDCDVVSADVREMAKEQGIGIEEAARKVRYGAFVECARQCGAKFVAVAHHQDDQVETVLHHIVRGTGLKGLEGIPRTRELSDGVTLIRPMLDVPRSVVMRFIEERGLQYREDETNRDNAFTRNRIRNELLPQLERDFNPQVRAALLRLSQQAMEAQAVVDERVLSLIERCCEFTESNVRVRCDLLRDVPRSLVRSLMREVWINQNWPRQKMGFDEWDSLAGVVSGELAGRDLPGGVNVSRRRATMLLRRN